MLTCFSALATVLVLAVAAVNGSSGESNVPGNSEQPSLLSKQEDKFNELVKEYEENIEQHLTITPEELNQLK